MAMTDTARSMALLVLLVISVTRLIKRAAGRWLPQSATEPMTQLTRQRIKQLKLHLEE